MLLTTDVTQTNCSKSSKEFSIKNSPIAFEILSSKLYSDPILAIIRELMCNAYDAHKEANNLDTPIDVQLPSWKNPTFKIRDYGTGLSPEDVEYLYTTFFGSTKSTSNEYTGGFGLGSKTPFAYTNMFTVVSFFNNTKYSYVCTKKNGYPSIIKTGEEPTEEHNGLQIEIPVEESDYSLFYKKFNQYIRYIPEYKINGVKVTPDRQIISNNGITIYADYDFTGLYIKQGQNTYFLGEDPKKYCNKVFSDSVNTVMYYYAVVYEVPIGTIPITPNREQLDSSESSKLILDNIVDNLNMCLHNVIVDNLKEFVKYSDSYGVTRTITSALNNKYFPRDNRGRYNLPIIFESPSTMRIVWDKTYCLEPGESNFEYGAEYSLKVDTKTLIVFTKDAKYKGGYNKLNNIIKYHGIYSDYHIILIALSNDSIDYRRKWNKVLHTLSNVSELTFDITVTNMAKLVRQYPLPKTKRGEKKVIDENKPLNAAIIDINQATYRYYNLNSISSFRSTVKAINARHNLILVREYGENLSRLDSMIHFLASIDNNIVYRKFIKDILNISTLDTYNFSFLIVAKSNEKYFLDMPYIDINKVLEFLRNNNFRVTNNILLLKEFDSVEKYFANHLRKKELDYVSKTMFFKQHMYVAKMLHDMDYKKIFPIYDEDEFNKLSQGLPSDIVDKFIVNVPDLLKVSRTLKSVYEYIYCKDFCENSFKLNKVKVVQGNYREHKTKILTMMRSK